MRDAYHEELDSISDQLVEMARLAGSAMDRATTALLDADLGLAESVIAADDVVDKLRNDIDERSFTLLARQQPVHERGERDVRLLREGGGNGRRAMRVQTQRQPFGVRPLHGLHSRHGDARGLTI